MAILKIYDHDSNGNMFLAGSIKVSKAENVYLETGRYSYDFSWVIKQAKEYDKKVASGEISE